MSRYLKDLNSPIRIRTPPPPPPNTPLPFVSLTERDPSLYSTKPTVRPLFDGAVAAGRRSSSNSGDSSSLRSPDYSERPLSASSLLQSSRNNSAVKRMATSSRPGSGRPMPTARPWSAGRKVRFQQRSSEEQENKAKEDPFGLVRQISRHANAWNKQISSQRASEETSFAFSYTDHASGGATGCQTNISIMEGNDIINLGEGSRSYGKSRAMPAHLDNDLRLPPTSSAMMTSCVCGYASCFRKMAEKYCQTEECCTYIQAWPRLSTCSSSSNDEPSFFDQPVPVACKQSWNFLVQLVCSQVGLLCLVVAWSLVGAVVFEKLEGLRFLSTQQQLLSEQQGSSYVHPSDYIDVTKARTDVVLDLATELRQVTQTEPIWRQKIEQYLVKYEKILVQFFKDGKLVDGAVDQWNFADAWFFSISLLTTLGFCSLTPVSNWSRLFLVPYSICGTPLFFYLIINASKGLTSTLKRVYVRMYGEIDFQPLPPDTPTRYGEPRHQQPMIPTSAAIDMESSSGEVSGEEDQEELNKIRKWGAGVVPRDPVTKHKQNSGCQTDFVDEEDLYEDEEEEDEENEQRRVEHSSQASLVPARRDYSRMNGSVPTGTHGQLSLPPVFSVESEIHQNPRRLSRLLSPTVSPTNSKPVGRRRNRGPPCWISLVIFLLWYTLGYLALAFWQGFDHETAASLPFLVIFSTHFGHYASQAQKSLLFWTTVSLYAMVGMVLLFLLLHSLWLRSKSTKYPRPWQRTVWL